MSAWKLCLIALFAGYFSQPAFYIAKDYRCALRNKGDDEGIRKTFQHAIQYAASRRNSKGESDITIEEFLFWAIVLMPFNIVCRLSKKTHEKKGSKELAVCHRNFSCFGCCGDAIIQEASPKGNQRAGKNDEGILV